MIISVFRSQNNECASAVDALEDRGVHDVDDVGVLRVGDDIRVIPGARANAAITAHETPSLAGVVGAPESTAVGFDDRVDTIRIRG